jgi:hypothetical protein
MTTTPRLPFAKPKLARKLAPLVIVPCPACGLNADTWVAVSGRRHCVRCGADLADPTRPGVGPAPGWEVRA